MSLNRSLELFPELDDFSGYADVGSLWPLQARMTDSPVNVPPPPKRARSAPQSVPGPATAAMLTSEASSSSRTLPLHAASPHAESSDSSSLSNSRPHSLSGSVVSNPSQSSSQRRNSRKRQVLRGTACVSCRRTKRKCDGEDPCNQCARRDRPCIRDVPKDELEEPFDGPGTQCDMKFEWPQADGVEFGSIESLESVSLTWASQKFLELLGYSMAELQGGLSPLEIVHSIDGINVMDVLSGKVPKPVYSLPPGVTELKGTSFGALMCKDGQVRRLRMRRRIEFITKNGVSRPKRGYVALCEVMSTEPAPTASSSNKE